MAPSPPATRRGTVASPVPGATPITRGTTTSAWERKRSWSSMLERATYSARPNGSPVIRVPCCAAAVGPSSAAATPIPSGKSQGSSCASTMGAKSERAPSASGAARCLTECQRAEHCPRCRLSPDEATCVLPGRAGFFASGPVLGQWPHIELLLERKSIDGKRPSQLRAHRRGRWAVSAPPTPASAAHPPAASRRRVRCPMRLPTADPEHPRIAQGPLHTRPAPATCGLAEPSQGRPVRAHHEDCIHRRIEGVHARCQHQR